MLAAALLLPAAAAADDDRWSLDAEGAQLSVSGLDRDVLLDVAGPAAAGGGARTSLDTEDGFGWRAELRRAGDRWTWGADFLLLVTDQDAPRVIGAAAPGGTRTFVVGGGEVASNGPGEPLYFERLEDTTVEFWSADVTASRAFWTGDGSELRFVLGVRAADFDNDYRAVVGIEEAGGLRLDAASNYDRMHGPVVGLEGSLERGRHRFAFHFGQAVVWGDVELSSRVREFVGPPSRDVDAVPGVVAETRFERTESVTIPMTELRLKWRYRLTDHLAAGLGAVYQRWWDLAVPPGVDAGVELSTLAELTMEVFGATAGVTFSF
jgi:hypothetical protein